MKYSLVVENSEVEGERKVRLSRGGQLEGNIFARTVEEAVAELQKRMRSMQSVGMLIFDSDIESLVEQLRSSWK